VLGLLLTSQKAAESFGTDGGTIINVSSGAGINPPPGASVYSATKGAVDVITKSLSKSLGAHKIRVNSLNPGMIETEDVHTAGFIGTDFHKTIIAQTSLGRIGQPDDIGPVAVFLASEDSGWVTGQTLLVSGGQL
jgi:3-oxoacyl-[acyl-carrier protein] reductase